MGPSLAGGQLHALGSCLPECLGGSEEKKTVLGKEFRPPTLLDQLSSLAHRVQFTLYYKILYLLIIICSTVLVIWTFWISTTDYHMRTSSPWYYRLEVFITVLLVIEMLIRILAERRAYWRQKGNLVDFAIMCVCVLSLCVLISNDSETDPKNEEDNSDKNFREVATTFVIILRFVAQFCRLGLAVKNHRRSTIQEADVLNIAQGGISLGELGGDDLALLDEEASPFLLDPPEERPGASGLGERTNVEKS